MDTTFRHNLALVTFAHVGVIVALLVVALIRGCASPQRTPDIMTYVSLQAVPPPPETTSDPEPAPVEEQPLPEPDPVPEVARPAPRPPPRKIEISKRRIRQTDPNPPAPKRPTPDEIKRQLAMNQTPAPVAVSLPAWYYDLVRSALYDAWDEPSAASVQAGVTAQVAFHVSRSGAISERRLARPSGDAVMDASVMQALRSVGNLKQLPNDFKKDHEVITVVFELSGTP